MKLIQQANRNARNDAKNLARIIKRDGKRVGEVIKALQKADINVLHVTVDGNSYNVRITGSRADLDIMFGVLRRAGLTPSDRPQEKEQYYTAFWDFNTGFREYVWISFASTSCKRVQVRTEMQEVPVYETVCEE